MYSIDSISSWELGMTCIVLIGYLSGKLWMYYRIDKDTKKPNKEVRIKSGRKSRGVIKRGTEWEND
jgi:hypothetical protein